ncbi:MarR family winged helix-turn-helix transcriptional regulator [Kibdelosporangium phytohabitans]|uniref:MarR family transcriptional regulator n=1 Tax=Kibdelosporangium phytohabitans TaxID=860235 RepID=A0A0N9HVN8_9PSEU|nr:MarR family transcriptional regulator [Kibdelosporangium phytohabitans]ALG06016.1 MarR family transcriptional regulator [Kibdelosporangium phytohabitans]MBE1465914.1 DNA-binding MarR family transcriptional regulator [Kibdelosporangium phytohabitans]
MSTSAERGTYPVPPDELARFANMAREMSGLTVLFHSRIAEQMGVSATDYKCLDIAMRVDEPLTAGQIAKMSGLSTGAVTGVIDRLEKHGFVRRVRDPHDRRKVLVEVTKMDETKYAHMFMGAMESMHNVLSRFTPEEREVVERFQRVSIEGFREEAFAGLDNG